MTLSVLWVVGGSSQSVGVVLSGGGATAMAHIGFLKALEENDIPIDYIGGTSMGAVVAAMYACGYTPQEMEKMATSPEYASMLRGEIDRKLVYYFKRPDDDVSMAHIKYSRGEFITSALPSNLIDPVMVDWSLMENLSQADAAAGYNFDSLFVPFRCIAADITTKSQVVFRNGPLNVAVRASSTYPFYLPAREVEGRLLFDGGLYNNFPSDLIYKEFIPDVILGCNVTENSAPPRANDLFSQLENMIISRSNFGSLCEQMLVVEPPTDAIGTFDFDKIVVALDAGYRATLDSMPGIADIVTQRINSETRHQKRQQFRSRFLPLMINEVEITGLESGQKQYVRSMMGREALVPLHALKKPYFRAFEDDKIKSIFPVLIQQPQSPYFKMLLDVEREKDLQLSFGGNFSSRSINTGFVGLRYNLFGTTSATLAANAYFGRFYSSIHTSARWDFSSSNPISVQLGYTQNRWDFYKSLSTFFEDVKPSYIVMNERFGSLTLRFPAGNRGMFRADFMYANQFDEYYQTRQFLSIDTTDVTEFNAMIGRLNWERNTLNRKMYPHEGTRLLLSARGVSGSEQTMPGSTSLKRDTSTATHQWVSGRLEYINYFEHWNNLHLGMRIEGVASTQDFFSNYTASAIASPAFRPTPESYTFFLNPTRAHTYAAGGVILVYSLSKIVDLRAELHGMVPYRSIVDDNTGHARYEVNYKPRLIGMGGFIIQTPVGPASLTANYYDLKEEPWSILFHFGYILFNSSCRD